MKYKYDPPYFIKRIFKEFHWNTKNNKLLLTFDDGPIPENTNRILKFLRDKKIKALFFCVGNNIKKHPELARSIIDEGHTIGNHMFNHTIITNINNKQIQNEIDEFNNVIKKAVNHGIAYFRPPHGRFNLSTSRLLKRNNLNCVMWSLLTYDYKNDINIVKFTINKFLKSNSIIVFHDNISSQPIIIESLEFLINEAEKKGYEFGEPSECLK